MVFFDNNDLMNSMGVGVSAAPDPYEAFDEYRRRRQLESDRDFNLRKRQLDMQREQIAISRGQAEANRWYNQQMVKLAREKFEQDKFQFEVTATGYYNGRPTLDRERFQDTSLQGWTDKAISLAMKPEDWVAYKKFTAGVNNNFGSIPGLNWTSGGQVGNTTFAGDPRTNSLGHVLGNMGVNGGGSGGWAGSAAAQADAIANGPLNLNEQERQIYQTADEFARNPQGAAPGWWENLDPMTQSLIQGAAQSQGHDWGLVDSRYKRSRWGAGMGSSAAA